VVLWAVTTYSPRDDCHGFRVTYCLQIHFYRTSTAHSVLQCGRKHSTTYKITLFHNLRNYNPNFYSLENLSSLVWQLTPLCATCFLFHLSN
jgi:hypothetical protein